MKLVKVIPNLLAGFMFLLTVFLPSFLDVDTSKEPIAYVTMLLICTLGFIYCMNETIFSNEE